MRPASTVSLASWARGLVFLISLGALEGRASGAPIFTGDGAWAWVVGSNQQAKQQGGIPASVSGSAKIDYTQVITSPSFVLQPASVTETYSAYAASSPASLGTPLLELHGSASSPNPGKTVGPQTSTEVDMGAGWDGVIAKVTSPSDATLPSSIRLGFDLAYTPPSDIHSDVWIHSAQTIGLDGYGGFGLPEVGGRLFPDQTPVTLGADGLLHMSFGLTLPLSETGETRAFSIALGTQLSGMLDDQAVDNSSVSMLTLSSITLPDGTSLEDDGYTVTFDSGNPMPPLVPEPSAWLAWGLLAAGSAYRFRRLRNG